MTAQNLRKFFRILVASLLLACFSANAEEAERSTVVITLGTQGGPQPNPYRAQPANALQLNGVTYLIDAGNGVARQLAQAGIPVMAVKKIFITHNHDDHNADLGTIIGLSWSLGSLEAFDVYGPAGTKQVIDGFRESYAVNEGIRDLDSPQRRGGKTEGPVNIHDIGSAKAAKTIYRDVNVKVEAIENCHYHHDPDAKGKYAKERSYAFKFTTADRVVVFSGDTGPCKQLPAFVKGADVLIHEVISPELTEANMRAAGLVDAMPEAMLKGLVKQSQLYHTVPEEVGKLAQSAGVGMVVLNHIMPGRKSDPEDAYTRGVAKYYTGKVLVAKDLDRF